MCSHLLVLFSDWRDHFGCVYIYQVSDASDVPLEAVFLDVEQAAFIAVWFSLNY